MTFPLTEKLMKTERLHCPLIKKAREGHTMAQEFRDLMAELDEAKLDEDRSNAARIAANKAIDDAVLRQIDIRRRLKAYRAKETLIASIGETNG